MRKIDWALIPWLSVLYLASARSAYPAIYGAYRLSRSLATTAFFSR